MLVVLEMPRFERAGWVCKMADAVIAIDFGGTNIRAAAIDRQGMILRRHRVSTQSQDGPDAVIARIARCAKLVMDGTEIAVGVASPGPLDPLSGVVLGLPNLPGWVNIPLRERLSNSIGLPCALNNDANLAALGEHRYGAGRGHKHLVYFTWSTGIGGGVIINNELLLGAHGFAAELGLITVNIDGALDHTTLPGSLEGYAAGPAIARLAQARVREGRAARILDLAGGRTSDVSSKEVGDAAIEGDLDALAILDRVAWVMGLGCINALHTFDPSLIVIGGSVSLIGDVLLDRVRKVVGEHALPPYRATPIVVAELGDDCGLLGAAALAWQM